MSQFGVTHQDGQAKLLEIAAHYRCPEELIEDQFWLALDGILKASTLEEALSIQKKVCEKMDAFCMRLWTKKKIKGPLTMTSLVTKARNAESLAKMFDKTDDDDTRAERQRKRAEDLRLQAMSLVAPTGLPQPQGAPLPPSRYHGAVRTQEEVEARIAAGARFVLQDLTID